nr:hypothetical protein [Leptospira stimsonii]
MGMDFIHRIPRKLEELLGPEGTDQFVVFLNDAFMASGTSTLETSVNLFDTTSHSESRNVFLNKEAMKTSVSAELEKLRYEIKIEDVRGEVSNFRAEVNVEIAELRTEMAALRSEFKTDSANLRKKFQNSEKN